MTTEQKLMKINFHKKYRACFGTVADFLIRERNSKQRIF